MHLLFASVKGGRTAVPGTDRPTPPRRWRVAGFGTSACQLSVAIMAIQQQGTVT